MKRITVTDLTRFGNPDIVCMAGIDDQGACVRPLLRGNPRGYPRTADVRQLNILPGTILEADLERRPDVEAPHIEDHWYNGQFHVLGSASSQGFYDLLRADAAETFEDGFGTSVRDKLVNPNDPRLHGSIMTLRVQDPRNVRIVVDNYGKLRVHVTDGSGKELSYLSVTDLGFVAHLNTLQQQDPGLRQLNADIHAENELFLRIGLSRPHIDNATGRSGCWIQVNGIYTFPEYRTDLRRYD
jgi:hypothetical protein